MKVKEYFVQHSKDYCYTNNLSNLESETNSLANTSKSIWNFVMFKSDNKVEEAQKAGVPFKMRKDTEWYCPYGKSGEVIEERLRRH